MRKSKFPDRELLIKQAKAKIDLALEEIGAYITKNYNPVKQEPLVFESMLFEQCRTASQNELEGIRETLEAIAEKNKWHITLGEIQEKKTETLIAMTYRSFSIEIQ